MWTVLADWLPFAAVLIVYDYTRGIADTLGMPVLWTQPGTADKAMFGVVPTVWLQEHLKMPIPQWWEGAVSITYASFFLMPYVVAGALWLRARSSFRKWAMRFVTMSFLGVVCFILIPSAPPWAAAACRPMDVADHPSSPVCMYFSPAYVDSGSILGPFHPEHAGAAPFVERLSGRGWQAMHLPVAKQMLDEGQGAVDLVAAIPSLHAGCTLLFVIFAWTRVRKRWRPLLAGYAVMMAFSLVYTGEHYVVDVLVGWVLAVLVSVGFSRWERRRNEVARLDTLVTREPPDMESPCPPIATTPSSTSPNDAVSSTRRARSTAEHDRPGITARSVSN